MILFLFSFLINFFVGRGIKNKNINDQSKSNIIGYFVCEGLSFVSTFVSVPSLFGYLIEEISEMNYKVDTIEGAEMTRAMAGPFSMFGGSIFAIIIGFTLATALFIWTIKITKRLTKIYKELKKLTEKVNYCKNCGTAVPYGTEFCTNCGSKITKESKIL